VDSILIQELVVAWLVQRDVLLALTWIIVWFANQVISIMMDPVSKVQVAHKISFNMEQNVSQIVLLETIKLEILVNVSVLLELITWPKFATLLVPPTFGLLMLVFNPAHLEPLINKDYVPEWSIKSHYFYI